MKLLRLSLCLVALLGVTWAHGDETKMELEDTELRMPGVQPDQVSVTDFVLGGQLKIGTRRVMVQGTFLGVRVSLICTEGEKIKMY